jgi:hypothetical protein
MKGFKKIAVDAQTNIYLMLPLSHQSSAGRVSLKKYI